MFHLLYLQEQWIALTLSPVNEKAKDVKSPRFDYRAVASLEDALAVLSSPPGDIRLVAGGQSVVAALNLRLSAPDLLLDIGGIHELRGIAEVDGKLRIGALTTHAEIARSPLIRSRLPLLSRAAHFIAHPAIRNRGTIGGSVALADPAAEWPACMLALGAQMRLRSQAGERTVAARDFFIDVYETALRADEILTALEIPVPAPGGFMLFDEFSRRHGDFALVGLALCGRLEAGRIAELSFGYLGVGRRPEAVPAVAARLLGLTPQEAAERIGDLLPAELDPMSDNHASAEYRMHLAVLLARRLLLAAGAAE